MNRPFLLSLLLLSSACVNGAPATDDDGQRPGGKADDGQAHAVFDECLNNLRNHPGQNNGPTVLECRGELTDCDEVAPPDLRQLAEFRSLERVVINGLCVRNLSGLELLPNLATLDLSDNDLVDAWNPTIPSPFAKLYALKTLILSRTNLGSLSAIAASPALRSLTADDNELFTLRGLASLRTLRELNVAYTEISELQPLAGMALTHLDITGNLVSDLGPVRAAIDAGATVLADDNCIESCASNPNNVDCGEQSGPSQCLNTEDSWASGEQLSVPVAQLSQFLPRSPTTWTWQQALAAFELVKTAPHIDWTDAPGNCDGRAIASTTLLEAQNYPGHYRIGSYGALRALAANHPSGFVSWDWHVANAVFVETSSGPELYVLDPALFPDGPASADRWFARQVDSAGAQLDFNCERYNEASSWDTDGCIGSPMVDEQGDLRVSRLDQITGVVCSTDFVGAISNCGAL